MKHILLLFISLLAFGNVAIAHTGLESTNPIKDQIVNEELKEVSLSFEGKIEVGSTLNITKANDDIVPVKEITINENKIVGVLPEALDNGNYNVNWEIIGADGHLINGDFSFSVENKTDNQNTTKVKQENKHISDEKNQKEQDVKETPSYTFTSIISLLVIIVILSFVLLFKRKSGK